jgi:hypothetical protein
MARRLGFATVREFEHWEEENVLDHFANFVCDYLGHGYTVVPEKKGFVEFVDLDDAVAARIQGLEERRFELALAPDKTECTFPSNTFFAFLSNRPRGRPLLGRKVLTTGHV